MENDEKLYGRRRIKKPKPIIAGSDTEIGHAPAVEKTSEKQEISASTDSRAERKEPQIPVEPGKEQMKPAPEQPRPPRHEPGPRPVHKPHPRQLREKDKPPPRPRQERERDRDRDRDRDRREREKTRPPQTARVRVSIIIPAFDEQENIEPLFRQFDEVLRRFSDWEVVFVDDGSTDNTGKLARQAAGRYRWLRVVGHNKNRGLTAALETGFKAARGSVFIFYPADMQYHAQDIPRMISKIDQGADVVTGWRQGKYRKRFVSFTYNRICRMLFGIKVHDLNSVKAFRKEVFDNIPMRRDWHRYLVVLAAESEYRIDEVKVDLYPRTHGRSKFGAGRILGGVLDLFSVKFQISFMKSPLRFFGTWGVITAFAGFIIGLISLYLRFFTAHGSRTLLYLVILLVLAGLGLFALGFLAEVMVGLRDEISALKKNRRFPEV